MNNNGIATALLIRDHLGLGSHIDTTATGSVRLYDSGATIDYSRGGEIRARNMFHELVYGKIGIPDERETTTDHLSQVMRGYIGCHTHSNAR